MQTGIRLRHLFATLLLFGKPSQPDLLWNEFKQHICDGLAHRLRTVGIQNPSEDDIFDYGLHLLVVFLKTFHAIPAARLLSGQWPSMPLPQRDWNILAINHHRGKKLRHLVPSAY